MPVRRLILYLDELPRSLQSSTPKVPKNKNGPLTGRGGSSTQKRKKRTSEHIDDSSDGGETGRVPIDTEHSPFATFIEGEGDDRQLKKTKVSLRTMVHVAGLDPGMSGSGMCCASKQNDPALLVAEMDWPEADGKSVKVPSIVALPVDNVGHRSFGNANESYFGFAVPKNAVFRSYYKISLDVHAPTTGFNDEIFSQEIAAMLVSPGDTEENIEAMISAMIHLRKIHLQKVAANLGNEILDEIKFVFVFTYPAACSPSGIDVLYRAVEEAGYLDRAGDKVKLMSEAHAAAIAAFVGSKSQHGSDAWKKYFKQGSLVTVIDIGALTVDLTTVEIVDNDRRLNLKEAAVSAGGKCGVTAIHCRLLEKLAHKFGPAFTKLPRSAVGRHTRFFADCEKLLKSFDAGRPSKQYVLSLTLAEEIEHDDYDIETGEVYLRGLEVKDAIDRNLLYSKALLREQWDQQLKKSKVSTTIFCGGGSLLPYIFEQLKGFCTENGVTALRAKDPDSAVCRGAAISELSEDFFGLRLSRACFGIEAQKAGRQFVHWFILRGEEINVSKEIVLRRLAGHVHLSVDEVINHGGQFEMPIYMYDKSDDPPRAKTSPGVERISTIKIDKADFSTHLVTKLRKQLREEGTDMTHMNVTVNLSANKSGRLFFDARNGRSSIGKGPLRFDATERSPNL